jgi:hypothetical protein
VGGALIQKNLISFNILNDLPPLTSGERERGGEAGLMLKILSKRINSFY